MKHILRYNIGMFIIALAVGFTVGFFYSYDSVQSPHEGVTIDHTKPFYEGPNAEERLTKDGEVIKLDMPVEEGKFILHIDEAGSATVTGQVRGYMFFEADFPVRLGRSNGATITTTIARADDEWMTSELVPFTATFAGLTAYDWDDVELVFVQDNPSGLPENALSVGYSVQIK